MSRQKLTWTATALMVAGFSVVAARAEGDSSPPVIKSDRPVGLLAWKPGGRSIAGVTIGYDDKAGAFLSALKIWDAETGEIRLSPGEESQTLFETIAFSPDGKTLAIGVHAGPNNDVNSVRLIDTETGATRKAIPLRGNVRSVVFSPDGKTMAIGGQDRPESGTGPFPRTVQLWDVAQERVGKVFREDLKVDDILKSGQLDGLRDLVFSPDGQLLAAADVDFRVRLIDVRTGTLRQTLEGHTELILGLAFSPDGKTLVSGGLDKTVRLWDMRTGKQLRTLEGNEGPVWEVALSSDGKFLATGGVISQGGKRRREIILWDAQSWRPARSLPASAGSAPPLAFSPDGKVLAVGCGTPEDGGTVQLLSVESLVQQRRPSGPGGGR